MRHDIADHACEPEHNTMDGQDRQDEGGARFIAPLQRNLPLSGGGGFIQFGSRC